MLPDTVAIEGTTDMQSISEVFSSNSRLKHLVVFRCTLRDEKDEMYRRNRNWLADGKTGYWQVAEEHELDGIVILIDAEDGDGVEVWLGLGVERLEEHERGRWVLGTHGRRPFQLLGLAEAGLNEFLGKQVLMGATYIDADEILDHPAPRKRKPPADAPDRVVPFEVGHIYNRRNDIHGPYKG
jgi:hypothetical protein